MKKHNCLSNITENLVKQDKSIIGIRFDLSNIVQVDHKGDAKTAQKVWVRVKKKKKSGEEVIKDEVSFITHTYCPFCGKKYSTK
jgi:prophage DNA circulation protein